MLAQRPWTVPIPGTTKLARIEENLAAASLTLTQDDLTQLDEATTGIEITGDRYHPTMMQMIDR